RFLKEKKVRLKEARSLVTETDQLCNEAIIQTLQREFPDHGILSEESPEIASTSAYTWIVDPLDGTHNFAFGIPFFCCALALVKEGEVVLGTTYDPLRQELFWAEKGGGAFLNNGTPLAVSTRVRMDEAFVVCDLGYDPKKGNEMFEYAQKLWPKPLFLRILGSGALSLAYVAAGRVDLYLHRRLFPWDVASGIALVTEAGGKVTDWQGKPLSLKNGQVVAGNQALHQDFMHWLGVPE
ncbi:MAG: inositol monophosphatase family protein, partial [Chloroflexota bacterium]